MATAQLRVIVTRAIDPFNFWARIGTDASLAQFDEFENLVDDYCSAFEARHEQCGPLRTNQLILVKCSTTGRWRRAVVVSVDSEAEEVDVLYVDYSTTEFVPLTSIVDVVPSHLEAFPRQAWKFTLTGMKPIAQIWISRAVSYFTTLVLGQQHDVQLLHMDGATVVVDILIREGEKVTSLSSLLVSEGFALPVTLNGDDSKKGCTVPTFDLQSLASQTALKKVDDDEAAGDSDKPNIEQELFTKGIDCSEVGTYRGYSDFDLIAGVPRSPCDTIGDIRSQIQFMTENTEKLAQKDEIRSPPRHQQSKHSEEPTAQKARMGRPPRFAEWVEEGGKRNSSPRTRRRGLIQTEEGREHDGRHSNKGQRNRHTSPDPLKQGNHPSPGPLRKGKDHDSPDRLRKEHRHSPDPLRQGKPHSPALLRHGNRHTSPDRLRKGNRHTSPDIPRQGSRDTSPDHRGGNFGDGDGSHSKALIKPKSSKKRDKLKGKPPLPTSPEQRQNEYDWHSCQFTFKVGKILEDFTEETCPSKSRELHKLLSAVSPQLQDLPGDGAVYLCLDTIVRTAITDKIPIDLAVKLVESLSGFDKFPDILRNLLLKYHGTTIKVTTATKTKLQCRNFVFFLAMLFNRASRWEDSDAVTDCIISSLNKWAVFNTKATQSDRHGTSELFSECLCDFISVGGTALEHHFPDDNKTLFKCIREKILSNDVPRPVKEKMLQLLVNQHLTASATQGVDTNVVTMETVAVTTATKKIQTEETVRVKTANSATQVELLPRASSSSDQSALRRASCGSEVDSVKSSDPDPCDPYGRVKVMLSDLRLEELLDLFHSNAVRDSVLDVDLADLKDLLKECGVRPGELLEIKTYLAKKAKCQASANAAKRTVDANSVNVDVWTSSAPAYSSVSAMPLPQATPVLISPEDFVRPRSATDFSAASTPMAVDTVQSIQHPTIPDKLSVNPVVVAPSVSPQKHCSVPPGFGVDITATSAHKRTDDLQFSDSDTSDSFDDGDGDASPNCWRDDGLQRQLPVSSNVTNTATDTHVTVSARVATPVGSAKCNVPAVQPATFIQSDTDVPSSWFDREDALAAPELPKLPTPNTAKNTYKRKYSPSSIKHIVDSWLEPNNSNSNRTNVPKSDSSGKSPAEFHSHGDGDAWGHMTIPTNHSPGTSTTVSTSTDWPTVTETVTMPKGKTTVALDTSRVGFGNRRKKPSSFPLETQREEAAVEPIKHSFGMCQKRVCTVCGSEDHLIYDCPQGTRSLFFN